MTKHIHPPLLSTHQTMTNTSWERLTNISKLKKTKYPTPDENWKTYSPPDKTGCIFPCMQGFFGEGSLRSPPALFFKVKVSWCASIPHSQAKDHCTVAQWAEMTVDENSLTSCIKANLPERFSHSALTV